MRLLLIGLVILCCGCSMQQKRDVAIKVIANHVVEKLPEVWDDHCAERWDCIIQYTKERLENE